MPVDKAPEVYGLTGGLGRFMGTSTVAPASYDTNVSFQKGDFIVDPVTPTIQICKVAGAGGTATFALLASGVSLSVTSNATITGTLTVTGAITGSSALSAGAVGVANAIALSGTNIVIGSTFADKVGFYGIAPTSRQTALISSTDAAAGNIITILKNLGFVTT